MARFTLRALTTTIGNPLRKARGRVGIEARTSFDKGMRFVLRTRQFTGEVVAIGVLWDTTVHTIVKSDDRFQPLLDALMGDSRDAEEVAPRNFVEAMMVLDPYYGGTSLPTIAERAIDMLVAGGVLDTGALLTLVEASLADEDKG